MVTEKSTAASYAVSATVGLWGLTFNEWIAIGGLVFAIGTFFVNWYYRSSHYKLAEREQDRLDRQADK